MITTADGRMVADQADERRVVLPRSLVEEALSGGFSSLWLPLELSFSSRLKGYRRAFASGGKFLAIGFCTYGRGWFEYGKKHYKIEKNLIWLALPGMPFTFGSDSDDRFDYYWLRVTGSRIAWFRNLLPSEGSLPVFAAGDALKLRLGLDDLFKLLSGVLTKHRLDRAALLLGYLLSDLHLGPGGNQPPPLRLDERLDRILERLDGTVGRALKVKELAALCNVTPAYFALCFRRRTGLRVSEYICRRKMDQAKELLATTELPIKEIALDLAYSDQLYFSRTFKRFVGCSPLEWRRRQGSTPS